MQVKHVLACNVEKCNMHGTVRNWHPVEWRCRSARFPIFPGHKACALGRQGKWGWSELGLDRFVPWYRGVCFRSVVSFGRLIKASRGTELSCGRHFRFFFPPLLGWRCLAPLAPFFSPAPCPCPLGPFRPTDRWPFPRTVCLSALGMPSSYQQFHTHLISSPRHRAPPCLFSSPRRSVIDPQSPAAHLDRWSSLPLPSMAYPSSPKILYARPLASFTCIWAPPGGRMGTSRP